MSGVRGDFRKLRLLQAKLAKAASGEVYAEVRRNLLAEAIHQVDEGFREQRSPDGSVWESSYRARLQDGQTLRDTGRLQNSVSGRSDGGYAHETATGFEIGSNLKYARIHNRGGVIKAKNAPYLQFKVGQVASRLVGKRGQRLKRATKVQGWVRVKQVTIPKRQFLPENELPSTWREAFEKVTDNLLLKRLGKL